MVSVTLRCLMGGSRGAHGHIPHVHTGYVHGDFNLMPPRRGDDSCTLLRRGISYKTQQQNVSAHPPVAG